MSLASDTPEIDVARAQLTEPAGRRGSSWAMLGASALAAVSGLALAGAVFVSAGDLPSGRPAPSQTGALFLGVR